MCKTVFGLCKPAGVNGDKLIDDMSFDEDTTHEAPRYAVLPTHPPTYLSSLSPNTALS
jgi:hypothetical protein